MIKTVTLQFIALAIYLFYMGFSFCDGFKLPLARKLIFFGIFLVNALSVFFGKGTFEVSLILPIPTLVAFFLGWQEVGRRKRPS